MKPFLEAICIIIGHERSNPYAVCKRCGQQTTRPECLIPKGDYCYTGLGMDDNGTYRIVSCPYHELLKDKPHQENGYCHFLNKGDGEEGGTWLLWDSVKECNINLFPPPYES